MSDIIISILVPTYNRAVEIKSLIDSILMQKYPQKNYELIIVDDGSEKEQFEELEEYLKKININSKLIYQEHSGPGAARNTAIKNSSGYILAFTESDIVLDENWLLNGSRHFKTNDIYAVEGVTRYLGTKKNIRKFEQGYNLGFLPCNIMFRKDVFDIIGLYDTDFFDKKKDIYFREDIELGFRFLEKNLKIVIDNEMIVYHPKQHIGLKKIYFHARRYYFDPLLYKKHPVYFKKMLEVKKFMYFSVKRPLHYLCLYSIIVFLLWVIFQNIIYLMIYFIFILVIAFKYETKIFFGSFFLFPFPFYYFFHFLRGCFAFKSFKAVY